MPKAGRPIGLMDMFNAAGAIISKGLAADGAYEVRVACRGPVCRVVKAKAVMCGMCREKVGVHI